MIVDTHCHLDPKYFPDGTDVVIERAREQGVGHFVVVGVGDDAGPAEHAVKLAHARSDVSAVVGVHPHDAKSASPEIRARLATLAKRDEVVAVGEIGLDFHYDHSPRVIQEEVFRHFIDLAVELGKPIVIHTRSAPEETLAVLESSRAREVGGVIHCFSEDRPFARRALDVGFDLSFSGIVTFKKAKSIQEVARFAPPDRIMVETDSPYLAPVPKRGKTNEPANVVHTARYVAELRNVPYEALVEQTTRNAQRRFGLALS